MSNIELTQTELNDLTDIVDEFVERFRYLVDLRRCNTTWCAFCDASYEGKYEVFEHEAGCVWLKALRMQDKLKGKKEADDETGEK